MERELRLEATVRYNTKIHGLRRAQAVEGFEEFVRAYLNLDDKASVCTNITDDDITEDEDDVMICPHCMKPLGPVWAKTRDVVENLWPFIEKGEDDLAAAQETANNIKIDIWRQEQSDKEQIQKDTINELKNLGDNIIQGLRDGLGIESPSKINDFEIEEVKE